ncbi:MAG TPA: class I SAM-dependent methyltransferase [Roseiarcus sp.]|nr:class I SAM-dependent methyltransferase [Roseiarcus sp.]
MDGKPTAGSKTNGRTHAETAQTKLIAALAAPGGRGAVEVAALETAGAAIRRASLFAEDGARIGRIENFQLDFVRPGEGERREALRSRMAAGALPREIADVPEWRFVSHSASEISYVGAHEVIADYDLTTIGRPSSLSFDAAGEIEVLLFAHPWSGEAEVRYGDTVVVVELYAPHTTIPHPVKLDLGPATQRVTITSTGRKNDLSAGRQCLFGGFRHRTGSLIPLRHAKEAKVRGAPFTKPFWEMLAATPIDGLLLDLGGGNRQVDDPRYINLDYAEYVEPDLIGDATQLPLRDESIDAVYSTGVFEHINDPAKAGAEVARVLKPGGKALIGWAFMQPVHNEGAHFYNATRWGVEQAFSALKPQRVWYDNSLANLVRWGASVSGLAGKVPAEEIAAVLATLSRWDGLVPATHKQYMANGVWCEFEKA